MLLKINIHLIFEVNKHEHLMTVIALLLNVTDLFHDIFDLKLSTPVSAAGITLVYLCK